MANYWSWHCISRIGGGGWAKKGYWEHCTLLGTVFKLKNQGQEKNWYSAVCIDVIVVR